MAKAKTQLRITLDKKEWAATLRSATRVRTLPKRGVRMLLIPSPDGGAEAMPFCAEEGDQGTRCIVKPTSRPGGTVTYECSCRPPKKDVPLEGLPSARRTDCLMASGPVRCLPRIPNGCRGTCELLLVEKVMLGKTLFVTACRCTNG